MYIDHNGMIVITWADKPLAWICYHPIQAVVGLLVIGLVMCWFK